MSIIIVNVKNLIFVCSVAGLCLACSPRAAREAKGVVAQADSLWHAGQMYGVDAGDSATLAQAYETLGAIPLPFREGLGLGSSYARSCYHYGRLLRAKEDPVSAMQVFINATHSHTRDYHILGRMYSNMGDIAHLAGEYSLSYDMYEKSGEMFLYNGDSLNYYYAMNEMALELAEQGKKEETVTLLTSVSDKCTDQGVLTKLFETTAEMYCKVQQYDSAIFYVNRLVEMGYNLPSGMLIKAQAFSYLAEKDSALYYARKVAHTSHSLNDLYNALYILSYDDTTLVTDEILKLTSQRDDLHTYKIDVQKTEHSKAVQILKQAEEYSAHFYQRVMIAFAVVICILAIGIGIIIYIHHKRRLLQKEASNIAELNTKMSQLVQERTNSQNKLMAQFKHNCQILNSPESIRENLAWNDYAKLCTIADTLFSFIASKLQKTNLLNDKEIRLCILVLIGTLNSKQMADLLCYGESGIRNFKSHTASKLGTNGKELQDFLIKMAFE